MKYEDRRKNFERWNAELEALHNSNPLNRLLGPERETLVPAIDFFSSNRIEIGIGWTEAGAARMCLNREQATWLLDALNELYPKEPT